MRAIRAALFLATALVWASGLRAECDTTSDDWTGCAAGEVYDATFEATVEKAKRGAEEATEKKVANAPAAATAPSSFAGKIHGSYEDFLKLLAFAINDVEESEDGKALVIRLNPLRHGAHRLGLTLTVAEPGIGEAVQNAIAEDGRSDTIGLLEKELDDFDDLTFAASYSWFTETCTIEQVVSKNCYGRDPESYKTLLSRLIPDPVVGSPDMARLTALFPDADPDVGILPSPLAEDENSRGEQIEELVALAKADAKASLEEVELLTEAGIDLLWPLVDNQPQLALTASTRNADSLVGQEYDAFALELQFGGKNVNRLFRGCTVGDVACPRKRLEILGEEKSRPGAKLTDGKWVLSATYIEREAYELDALPIADPPGAFTPVSLADSSELKVKAQWGALISTAAGAWTPRVDFSAEGLETRDDGIRTTSRWVATATLTLPIAEGVTIPVSLNYANKPEFLGEQDKSLGAHVGLSYKLPFGDGK